MKIRKCSFFVLLLAISIMLGAMNFKNLQLYFMAISFVLTIIIVLLSDRKLIINHEVIILILFGVTYTAIVFIQEEIGLLTGAMYISILPMSYIIGYEWIRSGISFKKLYFIISLGLFIHGALNFSITGAISVVNRRVPDFWTGVAMNATLQGVYFTLVISISFYAIFYCKNILLKILILGGSIYGILGAIRTASRTPIVIFIVTFLVSILLNVFFNKKNIRKIIIMVVVLLIIGIILIQTYNADVAGIKTNFENSEFFQRMELLDEDVGNQESRLDAQIYVLSHMLDEPLGGHRLTLPNGIAYAHNLWLDVICRAGIFPFIILICYTIISIINIIRFIKNMNICVGDKILITSSICGAYANFMVEPIIEGAFFFLAYVIMLNGAIKKWLLMKG